MFHMPSDWGLDLSGEEMFPIECLLKWLYSNVVLFLGNVVDVHFPRKDFLSSRY